MHGPGRWFFTLANISILTSTVINFHRAFPKLFVLVFGFLRRWFSASNFSRWLVQSRSPHAKNQAASKLW